MIDNSRITLEDNLEYDVVDKIKNNDISYVYLVDVNDSEDLVIRKEKQENGTCLLVGLDDEEEFKLALQLYLKNNLNN